MSPRSREHILANLDTLYREAYERAKTAGDERRMADLDASYRREQLLLEVLLDIRDTLAARRPAGGTDPVPDPVAALDTIRRITRRR